LNVNVSHDYVLVNGGVLFERHDELVAVVSDLGSDVVLV